MPIGSGATPPPLALRSIPSWRGSTVRTSTPTAAGMHAVSGLALAGLGRRAETLREVRWIERHEPAGPPQPVVRLHPRPHPRLGEADAAFAVIERLLVEPSLFSVHELRISPEFDPLRSDPRSRELLESYASRGT